MPFLFIFTSSKQAIFVRSEHFGGRGINIIFTAETHKHDRPAGATNHL